MQTPDLAASKSQNPSLQQPPDTPMKIVFIINNKNNRGSRVIRRLDDFCRQTRPGEVRLLPTLRSKHAVELAGQAARDGCDYVIAVGGDGTLHEVVNGVMQSRMPVNLYPAIGLLPQGSANDFARTARISTSVEQLLEYIQANRTRRIDLGKIVLHKERETRYFINVAGAGLSAEVVQGMEGSSGLLGAGFQYFREILRGFFTYRKKEVRCTAGDWQWEGPLLQLALANGRYFGNGICIAPDARVADGKLAVAVFGDLSLRDYLKNLGRLKKGIKIDNPEVTYHQAAEVVLESSDPCALEADGEYVGPAPATISLLPKALRFVMPPEGP